MNVCQIEGAYNGLGWGLNLKKFYVVILNGCIELLIALVKYYANLKLSRIYKIYIISYYSSCPEYSNFLQTFYFTIFMVGCILEFLISYLNRVRNYLQRTLVNRLTANIPFDVEISKINLAKFVYKIYGNKFRVSTEQNIASCRYRRYVTKDQ